jgi:hypothetical protein
VEQSVAEWQHVGSSAVGEEAEVADGQPLADLCGCDANDGIRTGLLIDISSKDLCSERAFLEAISLAFLVFSISMRPIRGDVKKTLPFPLRRETDVAACIQPDLYFGEGFFARVLQTDRGQFAVSTRRFQDAIMVQRRRLRKLRKQAQWL